MPPTRSNNQPESGTHARRRPFHLLSSQELMEQAEAKSIPCDGNSSGSQSEIAIALDRLDYAVDGAQEALRVLDGRLGLILHPPIPQAPEAVNKTSAVVPLASDIERYADRINGLVRLMSHLTERLGL